MQAKSQVSEVLLTLQDKHGETIALSKKLDTVKATNKALKAHVNDLENENYVIIIFIIIIIIIGSYAKAPAVETSS